MSTLLRSVVFAGAMAAPLASQAAAPTLSDVLGASGISASGVIDTSWDYSDVDGVLGHQFDVSQNAFSLHQVNVLIAKQPAEGVGFVLNPIAGDDAGIINGGTSADFDMTQAFVQYASGAMTVSAGRFVTLCGMEVINPAGNINASRSILFFSQPFVHTGVRGAFKLSDSFTLTGSLINSANNNTFAPFIGKTDNNTAKSVELQAGFAPSSAFSLYVTGHSGNEDADPTGQGTIRYDALDMVANLNVTDSLYFGVNTDYFQQEDGAGGTTDARGVAGYTNIKFGPARVAVRAEYFDVDSGAGGRGWAQEQTVTFGYAATTDLELLAEVRNDQIDTGDLGAFNPRDVTDPTPNNDQTTATIKAIYKF